MKPLVCNYYLTYKCNLTCEYCPFWRDKDLQKEEEAPLDKTVQNLKIIRSLGVQQLNICGGEPLLRDDITQILVVAKRLGFKITLTTNCTSYPEKAESLKGLIDTLLFSLDAPTQKENDEIRGGESFDKVLESIRIAKGYGEQPILNFTATPNNIQVLPEMIDFVESYKMQLKINLVFDYGEGLNLTPQSLDYLRYYFRRRSVFVNLAELEFAKMGGNKRAKPRCRAADSVISISPSGKLMLPCFYFRSSFLGTSSKGREGEVLRLHRLLKKYKPLQGKGEICEGCQRWPAITPSFWCRPDKLFWLQAWSDLVSRFKD